jgi:dTDP-4-dehydrorhamnose reductase
MKNSVLVLGGSGLLGGTLCEPNSKWHNNYIFQSRNKEGSVIANPHSTESLVDIFNQYKPKAIINLIAMTNVDQCELYPNKAYVVNVEIVERIMIAISKLDYEPHFIHISTDHIYDGSNFNSEKEIYLKNYYAYSKYLAEKIINYKNSIILRTNFFGKSKSEGRNSLTDWLFDMISQDVDFTVFRDQFFNPLHINTLCKIIDLVIDRKTIGTYNLGSNAGMSKANFAKNFFYNLKVNPHKMKIGTTANNQNLIAKRPKDMRMNVSLIEHELGIILPELIEEIKKCTQEYNL